MTDTIIALFVKIYIVLTVLPMREYAHAWMAKKLGDRTAEMCGRLTLNPAKHLDPMGALCMILFGFGWGKTAPVTAANLKWKNKKAALAVVAVAGPVSNIILAFVGLFIFRILMCFSLSLEVARVLFTIFSTFVSINIFLALLHLIPFPGFDGSTILYAFLPDKWVYKIESYSPYFFIIILVLFWFTDFSSAISNVGGNMFNFFINIIDGFFNLIGLTWKAGIM